MRAIDLHVHSYFSDGTLSPTELVKLAYEKGLSAMALTDHDCVAGIPELINASKEYAHDNEPLEVIPGVELSTEWCRRDIHMVGLYIDTNNKDFCNYMQEFVNSRIVRNRKMCDALREGEGFDISYEQLCEAFPGAVITRAHYARYLLDKGHTKSLSEAFDRYIGDNCKYFIPREKLTPEDGISLIHMAGGIAILAHPILYGLSSSTLDSLVATLAAAGLDGIEATYSTYTPADERQIKRIADKYGLLLSGGSDFHGSNKKGIDLGTGRGHLFIPEEYLTKIKNRVG